MTDFYSCILNVESTCTIDCNLPPPPTGAPPPTSAPLHEDKNCFSGASTVELENGDLVALYHVQVGDRIKVDADTNKYESIYGLGHHDESSFGDYLKIGWAAGFFLEISPEHMLLVSSKAGHDTLGAFQMIPASMVQVGDKIKVEGQPVPVSSISKTHSQGLYAPLTYSGTIVVNGVQASQYISVQNHKHLMIGSLAVNLNYQWLTHTFLFPVRAVAPLMNDTSWMQSWMLGLIDFVHYMFSLPTSILLPIAVIVLFTMSIMWIVESAMLMATGSPFMALSFMVAALLIHHKLNVSVGLTNKIKAKLA